MSRRFGVVARRQQADFRKTLSLAAQRPDDPKGLRNEHLLAIGHEEENLFPRLRGKNGAQQFFADRRIHWWRSGRSGDAPGVSGPTRNLASSQLSCVNFLLPLAMVPKGLVEFLRCIDTDVEDVIAIPDRLGNTSVVEFEWVGWDRPLEGGAMTRGSQQTSIDALIIARVSGGGRRAYFLEWKYCEEYLRPENKGLGQSGRTRRRRYQHLLEDPRSSFKSGSCFEHLMYEPFYQLMRMMLLADRTLAEGISPAVKLDAVKVVVLCPTQNADYRNVAPSLPLAREFRSAKSVEEMMRQMLKDPRTFSVVGQEEVVQQMRKSPIAPALEEWLGYHAQRYGW